MTLVRRLLHALAALAGLHVLAAELTGSSTRSAVTVISGRVLPLERDQDCE
jgi:hypothetical protein